MTGPRTDGRHAPYARALHAVYQYGGPLHNVSVAGRRRRLAQLLRGARRGWVPKQGLLRARRRGRAFLTERLDRLREAVVRCLGEAS